MNSNQSTFAILVGILAGIAAGLLVLATFKAGAATIVLMLAGPAAIYLASMGWGSTSGFVALIVAAICSWLFASPAVALVTSLMLFFPAAWVGHLTNLGQPNEDGTGIYWYPLAKILFQLIMALGAGSIVSAYVLGFSTETIAVQFAEIFRELIKANPDAAKLSDEELRVQSNFYAGMLPFLVPSMWLAIHVAIAYLSAIITARSGHLARPIDDIAANANLPIQAVGLLVAGLVGVLFFSGPAGEVGSVLLGLGTMGFAMVGLADLHLKTRGNSARSIILAITYVLIFLLYIPLFLFTITGLFRSFALNSSGPGVSGSNRPPNA